MSLGWLAVYLTVLGLACCVPHCHWTKEVPGLAVYLSVTGLKMSLAWLAVYLIVTVGQVVQRHPRRRVVVQLHTARWRH